MATTRTTTGLCTDYKDGVVYLDGSANGIPVSGRVQAFWVDTQFNPKDKFLKIEIHCEDIEGELETKDTITFVKAIPKPGSPASQELSKPAQKPTEAKKTESAKEEPYVDLTKPKTANPAPVAHAVVDKPLVAKYMTLQGKHYVTQAGLTDELHKLAEKLNGQISMHSDIVEHTPGKSATVAGTVAILKDGNIIATVEAHGYADESNVNANIKKHILHMAETRAYNRAMRHLTNINMTSMEELDS